ncbi:MAG: hypothetical protein PHS96_10170 [Anaerolineales bacterium]|nr:hypothetical protein [Anaerolineales bacterium]
MHKRLILLFFILALVSTACELPVVLVSETPAATSLPEGKGETPEAPPATSTFPAQPTVQATSTPLPTTTSAPGEPAPSRPTPTRAQPSPVLMMRPEGFPPFFVQQGTPLGMQNFAHPEAGCNWMGVGGQVFDTEGNPVEGMIVEIGGSLEGQAISTLALSGGSKALGPGGFEFALANHPIETSRTLWIQLYDLSGEAQSSRIYFSTANDCAKNLVIINFTELAALLIYQTKLPLIRR